jgi:hypothetical protein
MNQSNISGYKRVELFGIIAQGVFSNGKISSGLVKVGGFTYNGTYDDNTLLHGDFCSASRGSIEYRGLFEHGKFLKGDMLVDDVVEKSGRFNQAKATYVLSEGKLVGGDGWCYDGYFNSSELLIYGNKTKGSESYSGLFMDGTFISGIYRNKIKGRDIVAVVSWKYDNNHKLYLASCSCHWTGLLEDLPNRAILYVLCNGTHATAAFYTYNTTLHNLYKPKTGLIPIVDEKKLTPIEKEGLSAIVKNISEHKKNSPLMRRQTPSAVKMMLTPSLWLDSRDLKQPELRRCKSI